MWPVGQAVKTEASHASNVGSIPARVTKIKKGFSGIKPVGDIVGVNDDEGPPVPIPNTAVKLIRADNTCVATRREDKSTPTQKTEANRPRFFVLLIQT